MLEIHINISASDLVEAARLLSQTRTGQMPATLTTNTPVPNPPVQAAPVTQVAPATMQVTHVPTTSAPVTPPQTPVAQPMPTVNVPTAPVAQPTPTANVPSYTMDELAKAGAVLAQQGKMAELQGLLAKYAIGTIMELDKGLYGAFATDLRGLGAKI